MAGQEKSVVEVSNTVWVVWRLVSQSEPAMDTRAARAADLDSVLCVATSCFFLIGLSIASWLILWNSVKCEGGVGGGFCIGGSGLKCFCGRSMGLFSLNIGADSNDFCCLGR